MKKIIKCLFPLIGCSSLVLAGCGDKPIAELSWTYAQGIYTYTSTKHSPTTFASLEDATNEYFNTVSDFAFVEDNIGWVSFIWQEETLTTCSGSIKLFELNRQEQTITCEFITETDIDNGHTKRIFKWNKMPVYLIWGSVWTDKRFYISPVGFKGAFSDLLPEELENNHSWSFTAINYLNGIETSNETINYEAEMGNLVGMLSTTYFYSTFFEQVEYKPQPQLI